MCPALPRPRSVLFPPYSNVKLGDDVQRVPGPGQGFDTGRIWDQGDRDPALGQTLFGGPQAIPLLVFVVPGSHTVTDGHRWSRGHSWSPAVTHDSGATGSPPPPPAGLVLSLQQADRIEEAVRELEALNPTPQPVKSPLLSGKWELPGAEVGRGCGQRPPLRRQDGKARKHKRNKSRSSRAGAPHILGVCESTLL